MRRVLALWGCTLACAAASAAPPLSIAVREFVLAGRYGFLPGLTASWMDERSAVAALGLELRGADLARVRDWSGLAITAAVTEQGEHLVMTAADTEGSREASAAPVPLGRLVLPIPQRSFRRLERLEGVVAIEQAAGDAVAWQSPLSVFPDGQTPVPVPGVTGLALVLAERDADHLTLALDAALVPQLGSVAFTDKAGAVLAARRHSAERVGGSFRLSFRLAAKRAIGISLTAYPRLERVTVPIAISALELGVEVPGRERMATGVPLGAEGF